jgi:hypothetical protein
VERVEWGASGDGGFVKRISQGTWSWLTPGLPIPIVIIAMILMRLIGFGIWQALVAFLIAELVILTVRLLIGPRDQVPLFDAKHWQGHLQWGAIFVVLGGAVWWLRSDEIRFWGAGFLGLGLIYLGRGMLARRFPSGQATMHDEGVTG